MGLTGLKSRYQCTEVLREILRENPFSCLFQFLEIACLPSSRLLSVCKASSGRSGLFRAGHVFGSDSSASLFSVLVIT